MKANMRELENTRLRIRDEDTSAFEKKIAPVKKKVIAAITSFGDLQKDLADKFDENAVSSIGMLVFFSN